MVSVENLPEGSENLAPSGAGMMLRAAREAQGLRIEMLAVSLKVPVKKLEALEADRLDLLPDTVFVRALASSMCRALKIDVAPVLAALPQSHAPKMKSDAAGLNTTFEDGSGGYGRALRSYLSQPLGITIVVLLVGIFVVIFLPVTTSEKNTALVVIEDKSDAVPVAPDAVDVNPASDVSSLSRVSSASLALGDTSQMQSPVLGAQPIVAASQAPSLTASKDAGVLALHALGSSWVEVVDAKGIVQLRKTLTKDEVITVSGALPLAVVLGRADLVLVTVRGQPLNAVSLANDNVARFEVK